MKLLLQEATAIELKVQEMKHLEIFRKETKVIEVLRFKEVLQAIEISQKVEEIQAEAKKILDVGKRHIGERRIVLEHAGLKDSRHPAGLDLGNDAHGG